MPRERFPLVDVIVGSQGLVYRGAPAVLPHGVVLELFTDAACTTPADCRTPGGAAITSVTVTGATIPPFDGPVTGERVLYRRPAGATGAGAPLYAVTGASSGGGSSTPSAVEHRQATPAATWTVTHGLGRRPPVVLVTDADPTTPQYTDVTYPDLNTVTIEWPVAETGYAYVG